MRVARCVCSCRDAQIFKFRNVRRTVYNRPCQSPDVAMHEVVNVRRFHNTCARAMANLRRRCAQERRTIGPHGFRTSFVPKPRDELQDNAATLPLRRTPEPDSFTSLRVRNRRGRRKHSARQNQKEQRKKKRLMFLFLRAWNGPTSILSAQTEHATHVHQQCAQSH